MNIALDYDKTYTEDPDLWDMFIDSCIHAGHDIRLVTARSPKDDTLSMTQFPWQTLIPVIYCDGVAKRFHCFWKEHFTPDVWIDDKPEGVDQNSKATPEILAAWRASPEYNH